MSTKENVAKRIVVLGDFCPVGAEVEVRASSWRPFAEVRKTFGDDSLILANLECPLTTQSQGLPFKWANLKASPAVAPILEGLDLAALANNHIFDFGAEGARETIRGLEACGIRYTGYGRDIDDASKPVIVDLDGQRLGIVNLCCPTTNGQNLATHLKEGVAPLGMELLRKAVRQARSNSDMVLVFLHWGAEWVHGPVPSMMRLARRAIDEGADAVVGCHSHTIQAWEQYKGRWIFHGLGNFFFGQATVQETQPDGRILCRPLRSKAANRESLAVSFRPGDGGKGLVLERVQALRQSEALSLLALELRDLSFDLALANGRLQQFARKHEVLVAGNDEPVLNLTMLNGIPSVRYNEQPVNVTSSARPLVVRILTKLSPAQMKTRLLSMPGVRSSATIGLRRLALSLWIKAKWQRDKLSLPLTAEHRDIYERVHRASWRRIQKLPDLRNPRGFNDKIQWLKIFDQDVRAVRCADKVAVRDYIRERTGDKYLTQVYQVADSFEQIDFDALPQSFVIKATHDSGSVVVVPDKEKLDRPWTAGHLAFCLHRVYGFREGEWAYEFVSPQLMVEEFIGPQDERPCDYRFHCVNGEIRWIQNDIPFQPKMKEVTVDPSGKPMGVHFSTHKIYSDEFKRPPQWEEMSELARTLSSGWKYVRVDMFVCGGRIYAGEMTFFPYSGFYKGEGQRKMGQLLDFDLTTFKEPVYKQLRRSAVV